MIKKSEVKTITCLSVWFAFSLLCKGSAPLACEGWLEFQYCWRIPCRNRHKWMTIGLSPRLILLKMAFNVLLHISRLLMHLLLLRISLWRPSTLHWVGCHALNWGKKARGTKSRYQCHYTMLPASRPRLAACCWSWSHSAPQALEKLPRPLFGSCYLKMKICHWNDP